MAKKLQLIFINCIKKPLVTIVVVLAVILLFWLLAGYLDMPFDNQQNSEPLHYSENVDVRNLEKSDFQHLERKDYKLKLLKNEQSQTIVYKDNELWEASLSPDQKQVALIYYLADTSDVVKVLDSNGMETQEWVFEAGNYSVGHLMWLDNNHMHIQRGCGSGCTKLILLDARNGEVKDGVAFHGYYTNNEGDLVPQTFTDWFGVEHQTDYPIGSVRADVKDGQSYLVLEMLNEDWSVVGEDWWLFTGGSLVK